MNASVPIAAARGPYRRTQVAAPVSRTKPASTAGRCGDSSAATAIDAVTVGTRSRAVPARARGVRSWTTVLAWTDRNTAMARRPGWACRRRTTSSARTALHRTPADTTAAVVRRVRPGSRAAGVRARRRDPPGRRGTTTGGLRRRRLGPGRVGVQGHVGVEPVGPWAHDVLLSNSPLSDHIARCISVARTKDLTSRRLVRCAAPSVLTVRAVENVPRLATVAPAFVGRGAPREVHPRAPEPDHPSLV